MATDVLQAKAIEFIRIWREMARAKPENTQ